MNRKQYSLMNWEQIESIIYADCAHPGDVLGLITVGNEKLLQCIFPEAEYVKACLNNKGKKKIVEMEKVDDAGFFALFVTKNVFESYEFIVKYEGLEEKILKDPYAYKVSVKESDIKAFTKGTCLNAKDVFGSHKAEYDNCPGIEFVLYAPEADRVSVVGDFNSWDGRKNIMEKDEKTGVFTHFIPGINRISYKYEITAKGKTSVKADPFALIHDNSVSVFDETEYRWNDASFINTFRKDNTGKMFTNVCEIDLGQFVGLKGLTKETMKSIVGNIVSYGFDSVKILPFAAMDSSKESRYHFLGLYSVSEEFGNPNVIKEFVDICHEANLPVMFNYCISFFSPDESGLSCFDGICRFEHSDFRRGFIPSLNGFCYRFSNHEVVSFLLSALNYFMTEYHFDGYCVPDMEAMLYLDYGKKNGQFVRNEEGGNTNTEAVEFIKKMNAFATKKFPYAAKMAGLSAVWNDVTGKGNNSLGFDFVTNSGLKNNIVSYLQFDPRFRSEYYELLTSDAEYAFNEKFILPLSSADDSKDGCSFVNSLSGDEDTKYKNAVLGLAYRMFYPGRKETFYNVVFDTMNAYSPLNKVKDFDKKADKCSYFLDNVKNITEFTKKNMFLGDSKVKDSLKFINAYDYEKNVCVLTRTGQKKDEFLLILANFSENSYEKFVCGVPFAGKYRKVFSTDSIECTSSLISTEEREYDSCKNALTADLPAMSVEAYVYRPFTEKELKAIEDKKRKEIEKFVEKRKKEIISERDLKIENAKKEADRLLKDLEKMLKNNK